MAKEMTVKEYAKMKGISPQAVTKRLRKPNYANDMISHRKVGDIYIIKVKEKVIGKANGY